MKKIFKRIVSYIVIFGCGFLACGILSPAERAKETTVRFAVINVGQGLSQIVTADTSAIVFDMGPAEGMDQWRTTMSGLGKTHINDIVISHIHEDHWGGLQVLDSTVLWSGCVVTSPYADTAVLRAETPFRRDRLRFRTITAGDTLLLPGNVEIRCIWPPDGATFDTSANFANNSSLVFLIKKGGTTALLASDIDSSVTRQLCVQESIRLKADILVIPHHGSSGSLDPVFYGYVRPSVSIISYGRGNTYGHPSPEVLVWLSQMGTAVLETATDGSCFFESNGYYWQKLKE